MEERGKTKIENTVRNLIRVAQRWHGLDSQNAIKDFVVNHEDARALANDPAVQDTVIKFIIGQIYEQIIDGRDLDLVRKEFGDRLVGVVIEAMSEDA